MTYMSMSLCGYMHVGAGVYASQKMASVPQELEL